MFLDKEEYEEPRCPFCRPDEISPVPVGRIIEKLDEYLGRNDYGSAERHLKYWKNEAEKNGDRRGWLSVVNEQIGLYRKLGKEAEALAASDEALALAEDLEMDGTATMATTLINAATASKAFGRASEAIPMYEKARNIYEASLKPDDSRLGGLYNNMALALMDTGDYKGSGELFEKALKVMESSPSGKAEMAITYTNMADLRLLELGKEKAEPEILKLMEAARNLLDSRELPENGYTAYVFEKCAPAFEEYGFKEYADELLRRADNIYERS